MAYLTQNCGTCGGKGTVPRARRRLPNGEPDLFDTLDWPETICETCAGSGQVAVSPETVEERARM